MEFSFFSTNILFDWLFKAGMIILAVVYLLYAFIVSKHIKIMIKTLEDRFNYLVVFISSLQITAGLILLIFAIFLI
ncbi:MAG: hypothetical protein NZM02_01270 [Patescibacteria group bacterium]|nr:hypothetical protein [Patescibacteria group bacterium]